MFSYEYREHYRKNIRLAFPVMLSQLGHVMVGVADSVMVGQVGVIPLAAASFANSIFYLFFTFGLGVSYGLTPLVAASDGEGQYRKISLYLKNSFIVNLVTGVLLSGMVLLIGQFLWAFDQPEDVVNEAGSYLIIITFSIAPFMIFQTFRQFLEGLSLTKQAMFITIGANVINVGFNYLLIFGKMGFPQMGLDGAGVATLISRVLMAITIVGYVLWKSRFKIYWRYFNFGRYSTNLIRKLVGIGVPAGLQFIFEVGAFAFAAIMMGWLGAIPLAAHQIAINLASISFMMATGISSAAMIRVGNQLGKKDINTMRKAGLSSIIMVVLFMGTFAIIFIMGKNTLPGFYVDSPTVIQLAASLLVIAAIFQISDGVQVVGMGALRGMADVKIPTFYAFLAYWGLALPLGYFFAFILDLGPRGIWYGLLIGLTASALLVSERFHRISRRLIGKENPLSILGSS